MSSEIVVLVHGVWMPGAVMLLVKHHLERDHGFHGVLFSYPSVRGTLDENAARLAIFMSELGADAVHLVGHSLGGVVALKALTTHRDLPPGRVVCLGSPLHGSRAAMHLTQSDWGHAILGHTVHEGVVNAAASDWAGRVTGERGVGVIAGTTSMGLGKLFTSFDGPNDGTVAVAETRLPGIRDHLCMPVSHTGMVLSRDVAAQAAAFLNRGEFRRDESAASVP